MPNNDETKNYFRDRQFNPKKCSKNALTDHNGNLTTFVTKTIKNGHELVLCKDITCVQKHGKKNCPTITQSELHSKQYFTRKNGKFTRIRN